MTRRAALGSIAGALLAQAQTDVLKSAMADSAFRGQLGTDTVAALRNGKSVDALMLDLLPVARTFSHPPLSDFLVGAVVQGTSGRLYLGANIEIPGLALGQTVHAEQAVLANAYMAGEAGIAAIAVTAAPCGHCRQFLNEMSPEGDIRVLVKDASPTKLSALLPSSFGPKDLGMKQGALPVRETALTLVARSTNGAVLAALEAARKSYAPYTSSHSGIALVTADKHIFAGSYIENAAFNPSLSPLQTALAALFATGQKPTAIVRATLVEIDGAKISQSTTTRAALSSLAPRAKIEMVKAKPAQ